MSDLACRECGSDHGPLCGPCAESHVRAEWWVAHVRTITATMRALAQGLWTTAANTEELLAAGQRSGRMSD